MINELDAESYAILRNEEISLNKRIRKSKKMSKKALKLAYNTIENNDCKKYSQIIDKIIELELKFGNTKNAEIIALERLNKLNPNWKEHNQFAYASHLSILATINYIANSDSFYRRLRKNKGKYGVCGTTTYSQDIGNILWQAETLFSNYGKIYCLKFLKGSTILINEEDERAKLFWGKIYDLLIRSMTEELSFDQIKVQYEAAEIQKHELKDWEISWWEFKFQKSQYYFEFGNLKVFFKTDKCTDEKNKFKRCQPKELEDKKLNSDLYKIILKYAS
jgi:hypothetical protein